MASAWATKSEGVGLIVCPATAVVSNVSNLCDHNPCTNVTYIHTDRRTDDMRSQDRVLHYSASRGKNVEVKINNKSVIAEKNRSYDVVWNSPTTAC